MLAYLEQFCVVHTTHTDCICPPVSIEERFKLLLHAWGFFAETFLRGRVVCVVLSR